MSEPLSRLIAGAHVIIASTDADADRAFFRDVLGFPSVDAGEGWLIFALPPAEAAVHPGQDGRHELFLMCSDVEAAVRELERAGVVISGPISDQAWGRVASFRLPGGGDLSIYEPRHPTAI